MARFWIRGISRIHFLPAIAGVSPTRAEITAGTNLSTDLATINGFELVNSPITTPDLSTVFDTQIPGADSAATSSLIFYDHLTTPITIRTALAKGVSGFILIMPYGDVATYRCEKWPCTSTGVNDQWDLGQQAHQFQVGFSVTLVPVQNAVIPA